MSCVESPCYRHPESWVTPQLGELSEVFDVSPVSRPKMSNPDPDDWGSTMFSGFEEDSSDSSSGSIGMSVLSLETCKVKDIDPNDEEKICAVCGDKANGYHFHVLTCEGCKGFFRRSMSKGLKYNCPFTGTCLVTKAKRRRCQACRLQKCLEVGMRKDMILTDEALLARRELRMRKKQERLRRAMRVAAIGCLTEEQKQLISDLLAARKHFDTKLEHFVGYRLHPHIYAVTWETSNLTHIPNDSSPYDITTKWTEDSTIPENFKELPHFADTSTYMIQQVIKFSKDIPAFRNLAIDDQISLLKGSTMEVSQIQCNTVFNLDTKEWECGKVRFNIEDCFFAGFQRVYLDPMLKFHISLRKLKLHDAEYALMKALVLFSPDRPGIVEHSHIDQIQEKIAMTLKCYIDYHHPLPESRFLYAKLLSLMAELRTLNEENAKQMIHIQTLMSDAMSPLMKEIFS